MVVNTLVGMKLPREGVVVDSLIFGSLEAAFGSVRCFVLTIRYLIMMMMGKVILVSGERIYLLVLVWHMTCHRRHLTMTMTRRLK